jgi:N-acylglucosamine 2-epimerase
MKKEKRWLDLATNIADFAIKHAWDPQTPGWRLRISHDGKPLDACLSIYADGFAIYGLCELYKATGNELYSGWARKTADAVIKKLKATHDSIPHSPYPVPKGARVHGIPMLFSLKFQELGDLLGEKRYLQEAEKMQEEIFSSFYRKEWDLLVERISTDGTRFPGREGSAVVPGHVLEDMWFQIHIAKDSGRTEYIAPAIKMMKRHLEFGWDKEHGGILLARDAEGHKDVAWNMHEFKLWWPQTEALYACLLASRECGEKWTLEWYRRILDFCMKHLYMPEVGEWRQKLDRKNKPFSGTVVYPVKDPFHLPRSIILQIELLKKKT